MALALTGLRIAELAGLRWTDIDLNQNTIRVADERSSRRKQISGTARSTKSGRSRVIPIHPALKTMLLTIERRADGYVFHGAKGGKLNPRGVLKMYIEYVIDVLKAQLPTLDGEIGFEHGRLHSFQHYFCSQAFLGGASEGEIREWLGHASSKMVEHYRHLRDERFPTKDEPDRFSRRPRRQARPSCVVCCFVPFFFLRRLQRPRQ